MLMNIRLVGVPCLLAMRQANQKSLVHSPVYRTRISIEKVALC